MKDYNNIIIMYDVYIPVAQPIVIRKQHDSNVR